MKKRITATTLFFLIKVILNTGCEDSCLGGCPDKPVATTIFDLQYIPEKEIYERSDTVLVKILHSNVGDVDLRYDWSLRREIVVVSEVTSRNSYSEDFLTHRSIVDSLIVTFQNNKAFDTSIQININKKNHDSAIFSKLIRIK